MASDQWKGFHHAPHPDEDDDWYYDEPDYHLADQPLPPPSPPAPQQQHQTPNMLHYQSYAQPAPQPKVRVDLSRVSYSSWQNPWQSALRYQNEGARQTAYGGYTAWDYQDEDEEDPDEEYASTGIDAEEAGETDDSSHANMYLLEQDEQMVAPPEPPPAAPGPSQVTVPPPPPPGPAPPQSAASPEGDVVVIPPPPPVAPISIVPGPLPPGITVPLSPSSGKSVHFPEGLEDPKGTSIRNGKKVLNRKASLSNLKEQAPPKPIIPLVQKREHKGLTWKERQEKRRQDHEKRREANRQLALKWMEAAKKKKELDLQQKKEAAEKAKRKREEDAEKAKKKAEEDAIKAKKKAEEAKKKKEIEAERAKKKAEESKRRKELEAKRKEEARKKLAAKKSALKKGKSTKDASKENTELESNSGSGDAAAVESSGEAPPPAPDPPSASEEVTKSDSLSDDAPGDEPSSAPPAEVPPPSSLPSDCFACVSADPSADERVDAPAETTNQAEAPFQDEVDPGVDQHHQQEETQAQQPELPPDNCPVEPEDRVAPDSSQGGQVGQEEEAFDNHGPEGLGQGEEEGEPEPQPEPHPGGDNLADPSLDKSSEDAVVENNMQDSAPIVEVKTGTAASRIENKPLNETEDMPLVTESQEEVEIPREELAVSYVEVPDDSPKMDDALTYSPPLVDEAKPAPEPVNDGGASGDTGESITHENIADEAPERHELPMETPSISVDDAQHFSDDCCSECGDTVSRDPASSVVPIEDIFYQEASRHDGNTNLQTGSGDEEHSSGQQGLSQPDAEDGVRDVHDTNDGRGNHENANNFSGERKELPNHYATDNVLQLSEGQPDHDIQDIDLSTSPENLDSSSDHITQESIDQEENPPNTDFPPDSSDGHDKASPSSIRPQEASDEQSSDDQVQIIDSEQGEGDGSVPPSAPDVPTGNDQGQLHKDGGSAPLPPHDISEHSSTPEPDKNVRVEQNRDDEAVPPAALDVPSEASVALHDSATPTPPQENSEQSSASDLSQDLQLDGSKVGNSVPPSAPDAPTQDKDSQPKSPERAGTTEQSVPDSSNQFDQCEQNDDADSVPPAAPEVPSPNDEHQQVDQESSRVEESPEHMGIIQDASQDPLSILNDDFPGQNASTKQAGEDEKHDPTQDPSQTPKVPETSNNDQDASSDGGSTEPGESQQEEESHESSSVEEGGGSHDDNPQDELIQEKSSDPSAGSGKEQTSGAPHTTGVVANVAETSVENTVEEMKNSDASQDSIHTQDGVEDCPNDVSSNKPPIDATDDAAVGDESNAQDPEGNGTGDSETTQPPIGSSDTKSPVEESLQNHEAAGDSKDSESAQTSTSPSEPDDVPSKDTGSLASSEEVNSTPQTADGEDEQSGDDNLLPPAGETGEILEGVEISASNERKSTGNVDHEAGKNESEVKNVVDYASSPENVETQQESKSSSPPAAKELKTGSDSAATCVEGTTSPPSDQQDISRENPIQEPNSSEEQPAESSNEPSAVQKSQQDIQHDVTEPASEPQDETGSEVEEPNYTEADYRIVKEIMNPPPPPPPTPPPPPEHEHEPEPESIADQSEPSSKESSNLEDRKSDEGQHASQPKMGGSSASETGIQSVERPHEDDRQPDSEGRDAKSDAPSNDAKLHVSDGSDGTDAKSSEETGPTDRESTSESPTVNSNPTDGDKPVEDQKNQTHTQGAVQEMKNEGAQQDSSSSVDDPVPSSQMENQGDLTSTDDGQALDDQNIETGEPPASLSSARSDLSSEDEDSEDDDALSVASSTVAAVGDKEDDSQSGKGDSEPTLQSPQQSSLDTSPGVDAAAPELASGQGSSESKPRDCMVDSSAQSESTGDESKNSKSDAIEPQAKSLAPNANEASMQEPSDHDVKGQSNNFDSNIVEAQSTQVESGETAATNDDTAAPEEVLQEEGAPGEGNSQPAAQETSEGPETSETSNDGPETSSQGNSDPPPEIAADSTSESSPGNEQESSSPAESGPKGNGSSEDSGSADTVLTEDLTHNEARKYSAEGDSGTMDLTESGQPMDGEVPLVAKGESGEIGPGEPEPASPKTVPNDEAVEGSPSSVETIPETQDDGTSDQCSSSEEQHGDSREPPANDLSADLSPPLGEAKDVEQSITNSESPGDESLSKDEPPVEPPIEIESAGQEEAYGEVDSTQQDTQTIVQAEETEKATAATEHAVEEVSPIEDSLNNQMDTAPNDDADGPPKDGDITAVDEPTAIEEQSPASEEQPELSSPVENEPAIASLEVESLIDMKDSDQSAQAKELSLDTTALQSSEKEPEAPPEQHDSEAPVKETPPPESIPERVDDLPPSPSDPHKERKYRRRSSVSYNDYPYLRRHSTTSTGKGSYTKSSCSRDQAAPPALRRNTADKGFRRVSIPSPEKSGKYEDGEDRRRRSKERRRSHVPADSDEEEGTRHRRSDWRELKAAEVEELRSRAEQAAAELKVCELALAERERRDRHKAEKAAAEREKLRQSEEARVREQERLTQEAHKKLEKKKRRKRMEHEARKLREAEELERQRREELEREEARKQRKRARRYRERERRVSTAEGDGYPPAIPPNESVSRPESFKEKTVPPKPRRSRTEDLAAGKPRAESPPPKRQSIIGGLFGLGRSTTEPITSKTVDKTKPKAGETSRRPSAVYPSSSHRKHQRTPSEERRHQERKAKRRASKVTTASFDDKPVLHDPIPEDARVDVAPEEPAPIPRPSSPAQEEAEPASFQGPESEVQLPPPLPRAATFAEYGQVERDIDAAVPTEPGSGHGGSSGRRKHHHRRHREHHDGDRERDRERRHRQRRRNSAALDELVDVKNDKTEDRAKEREPVADQERHKGKHRSSKMPAEGSNKRDGVMEGKHRSSGSGRPRDKEGEREHERERQKGKGTNGGGGRGGGGFFGSLKKLVK